MTEFPQMPRQSNRHEMPFDTLQFGVITKAGTKVAMMWFLSSNGRIWPRPTMAQKDTTPIDSSLGLKVYSIPPKENSDRAVDVLSDLRWIISWHVWIDVTKLVTRSLLQLQDSDNPSRTRAGVRWSWFFWKRRRWRGDRGKTARSWKETEQSLEERKREMWNRFQKHMKPSTSAAKDIDKLSTLLSIWETSHRRTVNLLSFIQITAEEHKAKLRTLPTDEFLKLELTKEKILLEISYMDKIIQRYHSRLETLVDECEQNSDQDMQMLITDVSERISKNQGLHQKQEEMASEFIRDYNDQLFSGRSVSSISLRSTKSEIGDLCVSRMQRKVVRMVETGVESFLNWIEFTESVKVDLPSADLAKLVEDGYNVIWNLMELHQAIRHLTDIRESPRTRRSTSSKKYAKWSYEVYESNIRLVTQFVSSADMLHSEIQAWHSCFANLVTTLGPEGALEYDEASAAQIRRVKAIIDTKLKKSADSLSHIRQEVLVFIDQVCHELFDIDLNKPSRSVENTKLKRGVLEKNSLQQDADKLLSLLVSSRTKYQDCLRGSLQTGDSSEQSIAELPERGNRRFHNDNPEECLSPDYLSLKLLNEIAYLVEKMNCQDTYEASSLIPTRNSSIRPGSWFSNLFRRFRSQPSAQDGSQIRTLRVKKSKSKLSM